MITYIHGDLIELTKMGYFDIILQQSNSQGFPNKGIAKIICDNWPHVRSLEKKHHKDFGKTVFGRNLEISITEKTVLINIYSQNFYGHPNNLLWNRAIYDGKDVFDDFETRCSVLKDNLLKIDQKYSGKVIGMPLIASGLAKQKGFEFMSDKTYFEKFIYPIVYETIKNNEVKIVIFKQ